MIRLAHFLHLDSPGGGPKVVRQLLAGLPPDRFQQSLLCGGRGSLTQWSLEHNREILRVPSTHLLLSWVGLPLIVQAFRKSAAQIAILHGQWAGPVGAVAARWAGIPRIIYIAHHPSFYHSTSLPRAIRNAVAEMLPCGYCDRLVSLSERSRYNYLYRGWIPEDRIRLIPNGVDPTDVPPLAAVSQIRQTWGLADAPARHAVFVGRIDDQKRVDWLLEAWTAAWANSPERSPDWHLWIVGSGREFPRIQAIAQRSPRCGCIHFVGDQPNGMDWIAAADLVVMSSLYEGHALVPLEAMACGKPLASFDTDGVGESIRHGVTGLLSPLGDCDALGQSIANLLSDPALAEAMGKAGRARLAETFPLQRTLDSYSQLFAEVTAA